MSLKKSKVIKHNNNIIKYHNIDVLFFFKNNTFLQLGLDIVHWKKSWENILEILILRKILIFLTFSYDISSVDICQ